MYVWIKRIQCRQSKVSLEDMTFDDLILESAQSITKATSSLIIAATAAQRELVAQGKVSETNIEVKSC